MTAFRPVPATGFMPLAAVFDLDHTLIAGDATIGWTEYLYERGVVTDPVFREINERMKASYHAGTLDIAAWLRESLRSRSLRSLRISGYSRCLTPNMVYS